MDNTNDGSGRYTRVELVLELLEVSLNSARDVKKVEIYSYTVWRTIQAIRRLSEQERWSERRLVTQIRDALEELRLVESIGEC